MSRRSVSSLLVVALGLVLAGCAARRDIDFDLTIRLVQRGADGALAPVVDRRVDWVAYKVDSSGELELESELTGSRFTDSTGAMHCIFNYRLLYDGHYLESVRLQVMPANVEPYELDVVVPDGWERPAYADTIQLELR